MAAEMPDAVAATSVMIRFQHRDPDSPVAIVIGASHRPYFVFEDGRRELVSPGIDDERA